MVDKAWTGVPRPSRSASSTVLAALVVSAALVSSADAPTVDATSQGGTASLSVAAEAPAVGSPALIDAAGPLGAGKSSAKGYRLIYNAKDGSVVRWNPCAAVHYRVNLRRAPKGAAQDVTDAVARVSKATGIRFVYDGTTTTVPQKRYGADAKPWERAAPPLVIAWAPAGKGSGRSDALSGSADELGVGGWRTAWWTDGVTDHKPRIVTGFVVINTSANAKLKPGFSGTSRGSVLLHELGHVMGLDHVGDAQQLMYPRITGRSGFAAGDLAGLRKVGRSAGCLP